MHTQGQWEVHPKLRGVVISRLPTPNADGDDMVSVADCRTVALSDDAEADDNARLVAMAPELLDGVRAALAWIIEHRYGTGSEVMMHQLRGLIARSAPSPTHTPRLTPNARPGRGGDET